MPAVLIFGHVPHQPGDGLALLICRQRGDADGDGFRQERKLYKPLWLP